MTHEFTATRRVEFADTDMAGIMHFANYLRFMESTEHAFFRSLGLMIHTSGPGEMQGWARVHASCDYLAPLRYEDEVEVHLLVAEKRPKSIAYEATFCKAGSPDVVARGRWTAVFVRKGEDGRMRSDVMPPEVNEKITVAPAAKLAQNPRPLGAGRVRGEK